MKRKELIRHLTKYGANFCGKAEVIRGGIIPNKTSVPPCRVIMK